MIYYVCLVGDYATVIPQCDIIARDIIVMTGSRDDCTSHANFLNKKIIHKAHLNYGSRKTDNLKQRRT